MILDARSIDLVKHIGKFKKSEMSFTNLVF